LQFIDVGMLSIVVLIPYQRSRTLAEIGFRKSLLRVDFYAGMVVALMRSGGGEG
jgi:hypothetical protein